MKGLVLRDVVNNLDYILDKTEVVGCDEHGLTVEFEVGGIFFCTRFVGDGMCYTKKKGYDEEWMFDDHCDEEFLAEFIRHFEI